MKRNEIFGTERVTRRQAFGKMAAIAVGAAALPATANSPEKGKGSPPNILWLIGDDVGWNGIGCYGEPGRTPNLDRLAREGIRFTNAFVTSSSCSPSRASMFTGKYAHAVGAEDLHTPLPPGHKILPTFLKPRGYFTGNVGKLHLGPNAEKQFERVYAPVNAWKKFFDERPKDRPFFLAVGFHDAHRPFTTEGLAQRHDPKDVFVPPYLPDAPEIRNELAQYYDEITRMDDQCGQILARLVSEGVAENTLVTFFGDNGMPFPRAKTSLYDSGIGTPLILRWPGHVRGGTVQKGLASLVDLTPTALEVSGIPIPADLHGKSILPMILDAQARVRKHIFAERNWHNIDDHIRAVRSERFKYIRNFYPDEPFGHPSDIVSSPSYQGMRRMRDAGQLTSQQMLIFRNPRPEEELYDLSSDPYEFQNPVNQPQHREVLQQLREALDEWIKTTQDVSPSKRMSHNIDIETGKRLIKEQAPVPRK